MILFQPLRTRRVCVRLTELTIGHAQALCGLPPERPELLTTEFLRAVAAAAESPGPGYITDPRMWSVQERARLVCHYLSHVSTEGPDFAVGDGVLTDYLDFTADLAVQDRPVGEIAGREWVVRPLLGYQAELLERQCTTHGAWLIGAMACQCTTQEHADMADMPEVDQLTELAARIDAIRALPESDFESLLLAFDHACTGPLHHFLRLGFADDGIVFDPVPEKEAGRAPARFRADPCISSTARSLFGQLAGSGR